jgi:hypothetical protein
MKHSKKDLKSKAKIVFEGFRGEGSIAEVCCREGDCAESELPLEQGLSIGRKRM